MRAILVLPFLTACGVGVSGDFQGVPFQPTASLLAVADQNDLLLRDGAVVPVSRPIGQQRIHVLLSGAHLDPGRDWRRLDTDSLLEIKRDLSTKDTVLLRDIPLEVFDAGTDLEAVVEDGAQSGDFTVFAGASLPEASQIEGRGLGSKLRVGITPKGLVLDSPTPRGGTVAMSVSIQREREAGQDGDVVTGEVVLDFTASLQPERLGESNLTVAEPVVACMQERGPFASGACREEPALPYVDETGVVP